MFPVSVHSSNLIWFGFQKISTTQVYIFELTDLFMFWHFENTSPMEDRHLSETKSRLQLDGHQNIEPLAKGPVSQKNQLEKLNLPKNILKVPWIKELTYPLKLVFIWVCLIVYQHGVSKLARQLSKKKLPCISFLNSS